MTVNNKMILNLGVNFTVVYLMLIFFENLDYLTIFLILFNVLFFYLNNENNIEKITINRNYKYLYIFLIFVFVFISQNKNLQYEIISIDIPSYLVASQGIDFSNLPFETQWESKGPMFLYLYKLIQIIVGKNFVYFKIFNDLILFVISLFLFLTLEKYTKNLIISFSSSLFFLSLTSHEWYTSELSELHCLMFISIAIYFDSISDDKKDYSNVVIFLLSCSILINQSTAIFGIIFLIKHLFFDHMRVHVRNVVKKITLFLFPHLFFTILYFYNGLFDIYFINYFTLPFGYVQEGSFSFNEFLIWLKRIFIFNKFLFFILLYLSYNIIRHFLFDKERYNKLTLFLIFNIVGALLIYVIGGHSYVHHLFYFLYFISLSPILIKNKIGSSFLTMVTLFAALQIFLSVFNQSFSNLSNASELQNDYPLYQLSKEIDKNYSKNFTVLAFDHLLLLYYLDKENESYIIHPYNNFDNFIVEILIESEKLKTNEMSHFSYYIEEEPDVIVCNPRAIVAGIPTKLDDPTFFNCEVSDYKKNYSKINTLDFKNNENFHFYDDPYMEISLFYKNS